MHDRRPPEPSRFGTSAQNARLVERIQKLGAILPAMATDVAEARREASRLRRENERLKVELVDLRGG